MSALLPSSPTGRGWWGVEALGEVADAAPLIAAWLEALQAAPGDRLVLEQGAERGGSSYLRVHARPEVVAARRGGPTGTPVRLEPLGTSYPPPHPAPTNVAFGRLLWPMPTDPPGRFGREAEPPAPSATTVTGIGSLSPLPGSAVQAIFRASDRQGWVVHVRVAGLGERPSAVDVRDRTGRRWASVLGARYEPWDPASAAHRVAYYEWVERGVFRFHSGPGAPPALELLTPPWRVPGSTARPVVPRGPDDPGGILLGWSWETGEPRRLPMGALLRHAALVGMTGSGKTQFLAHLAAQAALHELPFVLFDLHGDLGPGALARLPPEAVDRVVVMDGTRTSKERIVGVHVLGARGGGQELTDLEVDRLSSEVLSALKPLGGGKDELWGPRMERFLEQAIRSVLEGGGSLYDVAELIHDPLGRAEEFAHRARSPVLQRALSELPTLVRRNPDLLSSSQNRLSKVLLSRTVRSLVAPLGAGLDLDELLRSDRSLVVHLPKGKLGESAVLFVANLLLARIFLSVLRGKATPESWRPRRLLLLDEAQGFSPQLLRSLVEEGRKFGCACVFATQSPSRLEDVLQRSPTEAVGSVIALRLPPADAQRLAPMLEPARGASSSAFGRAPPVAGSLATLPPHAAWVRREGTSEAELLRLPAASAPITGVWESAAGASALRHAPPAELTDLGDREMLEARRTVLIRVAMSEGTGSPLDLGPRKGELRPERSSSGILWGRVLPYVRDEVRREGLTREEARPDGVSRIALTDAGWRALGFVESSGASKEGPEHRRLLFDTYRIFERRGWTMEFLPQNKYRKVPDGRVHLVPSWNGQEPPTLAQLEEVASTARSSWLGKLTGGKDLHVEAEVSSFDHHADSVEESLEKARKAGSFLLLVVGTPKHGEKARKLLRKEGFGPHDAVVWVLRPGAVDPPHP